MHFPSGLRARPPIGWPAGNPRLGAPRHGATRPRSSRASIGADANGETVGADARRTGEQGGERRRAWRGGPTNKVDLFEHRAAGRVADYSSVGSKTVWPSGLRRWLKAPVRKGVGSNPTAVIAAAQMPEQPPCFRWRRCPRRPARASRPRNLEAARHRGDESAACPQKRPPWGSSPRPRGPCALLTELSGLSAILDVVIISYDSR
jgi:hypothetical protein